MDIQPYSIYIKHRPFRIAFLIDIAGDAQCIDRILEFNRRKWGGRFNPIILTNGKSIEDPWWKFLKEYDPDIIHSTVKLSGDLKKKIHVFLSPLRVEENISDQEYLHIDGYPVSISPTANNIRQISQDIFHDRTCFVLFEVDKSTPKTLVKFLERNFGPLESPSLTGYRLQNSLKGCMIKTYKVVDDESLNSALLDLGNFRKHIVFPSQICSLPNSLNNCKYNPDNEKFAVIIGDSIDELTYFWNRTLLLSDWIRTKFTQIWLPNDLIDNPVIRPGLEKFLTYFVEISNNEHNREMYFLSFSLFDKELKDIADSFQGKIYKPIKAENYKHHPIPVYETNSSFFFLRKSLDFHRAYSQEEHIVLNEPDIEFPSLGGEGWFIDLFIQFHPERFQNIIGVDYWWEFPKRNSMIKDLHFFNKPTRINQHGTFSVLMNKDTSLRPDEKILIIKLPQDISVFSSLICGESFEFYERNKSRNFSPHPYGYIQRSDKGRYLSGVLSLFPDLNSAHQLFAERYWRKVFERMSNLKSEKDERIEIEIFNKLKKKIQSGIDLNKSEKSIKWLARIVINTAKKYSKEEIDFNYNQLKDLAILENDEYNANTTRNSIEFEEKEFKEIVTYLVDINVLLLGVKPICPKCGYKIWYHINDAKQKIICKGCNNGFTLPSETTWYYRLNSLIRVAVTLHGTVPLILVLGQILSDARSSFLFAPSMELWKNYDDKEPDSEIDLICIKDGEFIIGEIKQSIDLFKSSDFEKIAKISRLIHPDKVLFSAIAKQPNDFVKKKISELQLELSNLEIKVEWYPINNWIFDPRPVR